MSKFKSTLNHGFQLTFENGWTISVQWGTGNYCERRDLHSGLDDDLKQVSVESGTAEIAIWNQAGTWYTFDDGQEVRGWLTTDEVAKWIEVTAFGMLVV